jgi:hypothetical protein
MGDTHTDLRSAAAEGVVAEGIVADAAHPVVRSKTMTPTDAVVPTHGVARHPGDGWRLAEPYCRPAPSPGVSRSGALVRAPCAGPGAHARAGSGGGPSGPAAVAVHAPHDPVGHAHRAGGGRLGTAVVLVEFAPPAPARAGPRRGGAGPAGEEPAAHRAHACLCGAGPHSFGLFRPDSSPPCHGLRRAFIAQRIALRRRLLQGGTATVADGVGPYSETTS